MSVREGDTEATGSARGAQLAPPWPLPNPTGPPAQKESSERRDREQAMCRQTGGRPMSFTTSHSPKEKPRQHSPGSSRNGNGPHVDEQSSQASRRLRGQRSGRARGARPAARVPQPEPPLLSRPRRRVHEVRLRAEQPGPPRAPAPSPGCGVGTAGRGPVGWGGAGRSACPRTGWEACVSPSDSGWMTSFHHVLGMKRGGSCREAQGARPSEAASKTTAGTALLPAPPLGNGVPAPRGHSELSQGTDQHEAS